MEFKLLGTCVALLFPAVVFGQTGGRPVTITSPDFSDGGRIPARFTADGENVSPALVLEHVPADARSLVLIVDDPDAPVGTWNHWLVWNIPPDTRSIPANSVPPHAVQGTNDFGMRNYGGPAPPSGEHRYFFRLYALRVASLPLAPGAKRKALDAALAGKTVGEATLMGRYSRKP